MCIRDRVPCLFLIFMLILFNFNVIFMDKSSLLLIRELTEENSSVRLLQIFEYSGCIVPKQFLNDYIRLSS